MRKFIITLVCFLLCIPMFVACNKGSDSSSSSISNDEFSSVEDSSIEDVSTSMEDSSIEDGSTSMEDSSISTEDSSLDDSNESSEEDSSTELPNNMRAIYYVGINSQTGETIDIPNELRFVNGMYPESFELGASVSIDTLISTVIGTLEYEFLGYFRDANGTTAFTGITPQDEDDVTVYARFNIIRHTPIIT